MHNNNIIKEKIITERLIWNKVIEKFKKKDIYFTYDYFVPFKNNGDGNPMLYYFECEYGKVAYPFMLRDIAKSVNFKGVLEENKYFDISSAYGYGGCLYEVSNEKESISNLTKAFFKSFSEYCNNTNIISQFDRFHPLLNNQEFFDDYCETLPIRKTIHMDLSDEDELWSNVESKCRNMIRKARKNDVTIVLEDNIKTLENFKDIYNSTMDSNNAEEYYYFNDDFFDDTISELKDNVFIANAYHENKIIASTLIMRHSKYIHYHFSGALREYRNLQANNLLLYKVAKWGNENGYEKFHLGGGYESEHDSLYKFKKSFSKLEANNFYIGKKIHDIKTYNKLVDICKKNQENESSFFPEYRR